MRFYKKLYNKKLADNTEFPCLVFVPDSWNDYGWRTTFELFYYESSSVRHEIGTVKVLDILFSDFLMSKETSLPDEFSVLDSAKCSLGQSINYYLNLKKYFPNQYRDILTNLNDVAISPGLRDEFEENDGFSKSLLRSSEAEKALFQAIQVLEHGEESLQTNFNFTFSIQLQNAFEPHKVNIEFSKTIGDSFRTFVLIGKNGTGKTQFLSHLGFSLCGGTNSTTRELEFENIGKFLPSRPLYSKVIAVSFSLFDKFKIPQRSKKYSYRYVGFRTNDGILNDDEISAKLRSSFLQIKKLNRQLEWFSFVKEIIEVENFGDDVPKFWKFNNDFEEIIKQRESFLSSGQSILIFIITELVANLRTGSIILFDEPETHLHPNAIARLIKELNNILNFYNSYAIIATHSPIVIQETPSRNVRVFDRIGNTPIIKTLPDESFGENLSKITDSIFYRNQVKEAYKEFFDEKIQELSVEQINNLFENKLSLNALLYLQAISKSNSR